MTTIKKSTAVLFLIVASCLSVHEASGAETPSAKTPRFQLLPKGGQAVLPPDVMEGLDLVVRELDSSKADGRLISVANMPFEKAFRAKTLVRPDQAWHIALRARGSVQSEIKRGDVCLLSFYMRSIQSEDESGRGVVHARFEQVRRPRARSAFRRVTAGRKWRQILIPIKLRMDLAAGQDACVALVLGFRPQTVDIADIRFTNYGASMKVADLPSVRLTYEGREADAPWRKAAAARIDKLRKANLTVKVVDAKGAPLEGAVVKVEMKRHAFGFGSVVHAEWLTKAGTDAERYRRIIEDSYNVVVFGNDLKRDHWKNHVERMDAAFDWLKQRDIKVRGHHLCNATHLQREKRVSRSDPDKFLRHVLKTIDEKVRWVGNRVTDWDACNHVVAGKNRLDRVLGKPGIYADIIRRARKLAPGVGMCVNEGRVLAGNWRRDDYEAVIRDLVRGKAAPDAIGFMGHFSPTTLIPIDEAYSVMERFAAIVPSLQITELDVVAELDEQADYLRDIMTVAFSHPAMKRILIWGFWEGRHWRPAAALYRKDWTIKPIGKAWKSLVFDKWWTRGKGKTDKRGVFSIRGFKGDYEVEVVHEGRVKRLKTSLSEDRELVVTVE